MTIGEGIPASLRRVPGQHRPGVRVFDVDLCGRAVVVRERGAKQSDRRCWITGCSITRLYRPCLNGYPAAAHDRERDRQLEVTSDDDPAVEARLLSGKAGHRSERLHLYVFRPGDAAPQRRRCAGRTLPDEK